jgi:hypothetical protein
MKKILTCPFLNVSKPIQANSSWRGHQATFSHFKDATLYLNVTMKMIETIKNLKVAKVHGLFMSEIRANAVISSIEHCAMFHFIIAFGSLQKCNFGS